ncbi:YceI family protein [Cyclobacterium sp. 1_MG-2023]|uniref:YceI family protein n=1 Tax=Cyclobacterium sp. 1_MG-2023 TaxID=3062681 RepID=UPI0026E1B601|nr:YceI family protein [Cyclobacterium sp. 1_MG-2023]MDO6437948.1 YceI family protein [Cyclobacterium sp. 1_MG-2023]
MKSSIFILLFYWFLAPNVNAPETESVNSLEESYIKFNIRNLGLNVEGTFKSFKTKVQYNESQPGKSSFSAEIQSNSIDTGITKRDNHLKKSEYFDVAQYPTISFQSTKVSAVGEDRLKVLGDLTIKGKTLPITLPVSIINKGSVREFRIEGELDRRDYKVGGSSWVMSDDVYLDLLIVN